MNIAQCKGFLNTPELWDHQLLSIEQFSFPKVNLNEIKIDPIPQNLRLGHHVEHIFNQLIGQGSLYNIVLHNLAIRDHEKTLGEIDFILSDPRTERYIHVELTYKFYIIDPEVKPFLHSLIGPNRKDRFIDKMEKIKTKQFALLHTESGKKALKAYDINPIDIEHHACFKAQLFQARGSKHVFPATHEINQSCLSGSWLTLESLKSTEFYHTSIYIPSKKEWIIEPTCDVEWQTYDLAIMEIREIIDRQYAPMIWVYHRDKTIEKLFVVWW